MKVRSRPSLPINSPSSKITLSRGPNTSVARDCTRSSGVSTSTAKSNRESAFVRVSIKVVPKPKKPSFQSVISASCSSSDLTARANSTPSDDEPTNTDGASGRGAMEIASSLPEMTPKRATFHCSPSDQAGGNSPSVQQSGLAGWRGVLENSSCVVPKGLPTAPWGRPDAFGADNLHSGNCPKDGFAGTSHRLWCITANSETTFIMLRRPTSSAQPDTRSEEHTSELQ